MERLNLSRRVFQDGSKSNVKQNHVSFPEFAQNGSAKQFANGTNSSLNDRNIEIASHSLLLNDNTSIISADTNTSHESLENIDNNTKSHNSKKIRHNKTKRKYSHSLSKYRRLELGKVLFKRTQVVGFYLYHFLLIAILFNLPSLSLYVVTA